MILYLIYQDGYQISDPMPLDYILSRWGDRQKLAESGIKLIPFSA